MKKNQKTKKTKKRKKENRATFFSYSFLVLFLPGIWLIKKLKCFFGYCSSAYNQQNKQTKTKTKNVGDNHDAPGV
jgi:hypothetical protein